MNSLEKQVVDAIDFEGLLGFLDRLIARTGIRSLIAEMRSGIDALPPFPGLARRG